MVNTNLKVKVEADTDEAVEAIQEVTEAVEELEAALDRLNSSSIDVNIRDIASKPTHSFERGGV